MNACINKCRGREKFKNFQILIYSGCSSAIIVVNMMSKLKEKTYISAQWQTQAKKFTTDKKVKVDFFLPQFISTRVVTWECHVYESVRGC